MSNRIALLSAVLSVLFVGGTAFAQSIVPSSTASVGSSTAVGTSTSGATLSATVDFVKQVPAGLNDAVLAMILLDATHSTVPVTLTSVPLAVTSSNGTFNALSNCVLVSTNGASLTTGQNSVPTITGTNTFTLDTPINIPAGEGKLMALRCNVSAQALVGSTFTITFAAPLFQANAAGIPITVTQGSNASGQVGTNSGSVTVSPQGSTPDSLGATNTPGVPNTGAGGNAPETYFVLALSLAAALFAGRQFLRTR